MLTDDSREAEQQISNCLAVVGVGAMGGAVARRLCRVGYSVSVFDLDTARSREIAGDDMRVASSASDAASDADLIVTCLPDGTSLVSAILGLDGVSSSARAGSIVLDLSTVLPEESQLIASELAGRDVGFVDCPVARTTDHALRGELVAMLGGAPDAIAAVRPVVEQLATDVIECGPVGSGTTMKLINNLCAMSVLLVTIEAVAAGELAGITREVVVEVLSSTGVRNGHLLTTIPDRVFRGEYAPGFRTTLAQKDVRQALEYLGRVGADVRVSSGSLAAITQLAGTGARNLDVSSYYEMVSRGISA